MEADDTQTTRQANEQLSTRQLRRIPLRFEWEGSTWEAHTALISAHGALILSPVRLPEGATLQVTNLERNVTAAFRVRWPGQPDGRTYRTGIRLLEETDYWGPGYDELP